MQPSEPTRVCRQNIPLTMDKVSVYHAPEKAHFDIRRWRGEGGNEYSLSVEQGTVHGTQAGGAIY
jgi:hypothetical protein